MIWTVHRRIAVGYIFSFLLLALMAAIGLYALNETSDVYEGAVERERTSLHRALRADFEARGAVINHLRYLADPEEIYVTRRDSLLAAATGAFERLLESSEEADRELWIEALNALERWERASDRAIDARAAGRFERAIGIHTAEAVPAFDRHEALVERGTSRLMAADEAVLAQAQSAGARWEFWLLVAAGAALVLSVLKSVWLGRAVSRPLDRTATSLASNSAEILEVTVQQTWAADRAAQAAMRAAQRFEDTSGTQARTLKHVERLSQLTREAAERDGGREEILRRLREESERVATLTRHRITEVRDLQEAVEEAAQAAGHSAATAQEIESIARRMNVQGMELLGVTSSRGNGRDSRDAAQRGPRAARRTHSSS